jgi:hypothetical protein
MLLMSLACDAIALGSNQVEVEVVSPGTPIFSANKLTATI